MPSRPSGVEVTSDLGGRARLFGCCAHEWDKPDVPDEPNAATDEPHEPDEPDELDAALDAAPDAR